MITLFLWYMLSRDHKKETKHSKDKSMSESQVSGIAFIMFFTLQLDFILTAVLYKEFLR